MITSAIGKPDYRRISVDVVPALLSFFDADHVCRFANEHHRQWYGRSPEELVGLHMTEFLGPEKYAARRPHLERVATGETVSFEDKVPRLDGTWREAAIRYVPMSGPAGVEGFFVLVVDIAPQSHRYHRVFDATAVALWEIDLSGVHSWLADYSALPGKPDPIAFLRNDPQFHRAALDSCQVLDLNRRAEEMFGIGRDEALAMPFGRWCPPECEPVLLDNLVAYLTGERGFEGETLMRRADGSLFPVHISTAFPKQVVARPAGTFAIMDISDRVAREQALARANADLAHASRVATLGELMASIAHEVNQPLAAVVTNGNAALRWLRRSEPDLGEATTAISRIIAEGARASEIIARTRRMATKGSGERTSFSPNSVVEEAMALVRWQIAALDARLSLDLADDLPDVVADRVQIQQVLINLVVNAAQAMAGRSTVDRAITVRSSAHDGSVCFEVEDTGPGLPSDGGDQLFNAFFTTKADGMGMGLSVAKTIVDAHGGSIRALDRPGGGAVFRFVVPAGRPS